jgi:tRNA(adenine34) deaminase
VTTADWPQADIDHMRAALAEAELAASEGEVPVGAVVVANGHVVASAHNCPIGSHDPSAHAEIVALRRACEAQSFYRLSDATLYVTLEPCVMCTGAIAQSRIGRVIFGAYDEKAGALGSVVDLSDSKALNHRFEVNGGLLAAESRQLLQSFFRARR